MSVTPTESVFGDHWYFLAVVLDNGIPTFYVDDQVATYSGAPLAMNVMDWGLGNRSNGDSYEYQGSVDDITIYDRALTAEEIQQIRAYAHELHAAVPIIGTATDSGDEVFEGGEMIFLDFVAGSLSNPLVNATGIGAEFKLENANNFKILGVDALNPDYANNGILTVVSMSDSTVAFGLTGTQSSTSGIQPMFRISLLVNENVTASSSTQYWLENILLLNTNGDSVPVNQYFGVLQLTVIPISI